MKSIEVVAAVIFDEQGRILLRNGDMASGKTGGSFREVRWKPEKHHRKPCVVKSMRS